MDPHDPQWRARRRALIKANHPDRGGDPALLIAALLELDDAAATGGAGSAGAHGDPAVVVARPLLPLRRIRFHVRRGARTLRTALPRRVPGSIRYIDISP